MVEVLNAGLYTSIQDTGRFGYRASGVPVSGSMDSISHHFANMLLNNRRDAAVIEFTWPAPKFRFTQATRIVVAGATVTCLINGEERPLTTSLDVVQGDELSFQPASRGVWSYIAVLGGWQTERILESRSQYLGITPAQKLVKGDQLSILSKVVEPSQYRTKIAVDAAHLENRTILCGKGPEWHLVKDADQKKYSAMPFRVSSRSNRMAYLLEGGHISLPEIISAPVQPGTVQITPSGNCIVLMRDAQTTGGYARIGQLPEESISQLAQKRAGEEIILQMRKS